MTSRLGTDPQAWTRAVRQAGGARGLHPCPACGSAADELLEPWSQDRGGAGQRGIYGQRCGFSAVLLEVM